MKKTKKKENTKEKQISGAPRLLSRA